MTTPTQIEIECRMLAHEMVQLEALARQAWRVGDFERVGELHQQRELVQQERSAILRRLWARRDALLSRANHSARG